MIKYVLTILLIFFLTPKMALMTQEGSVLGAQQTNSIYINLENFTYNSPSGAFIDHVISRTKKNSYSDSDDYIHYEMKTNKEKEAYEKIGPNIKGIILVNTTFIKEMITYIDNNPKVKTALSNIFKKTSEEYNCKDWDTYYTFIKDKHTNTNATAIAVNGNWQYFQCLNLALPISPPKIPTDFVITGISDMLSVFSKFTQAISDGIFNVKFASGMATEKTKGIRDESVKYYNDYFTKSPDPDNKIQQLLTTDHINLLTNDKSKNYASGACYEANPSGNKNTCTHTIYKACKTGKNKLGGKTTFVFGVTCEALNSFIADTDYHAKTTKTVKQREEIDVKIQVPFQGIKDGIDFPNYINEIYKYLISIGFVIAGIILVLGGLQYIGQQPDNGKKNIQNAIIGIILLSSSYTILQVINPNTLNLNLPSIEEIEGDYTGGKKVDTSDIDVPDNKLNDIFDPKIEIQEDWCFPIEKDHVNVSSLKKSLVYTGGGAFGYNRTDPTKESHQKYPNTTICHAGLDIFTKYTTSGMKDNKDKNSRKGNGTVIAITDGEVVAIGNHFTKCGYGGEEEAYPVGSIVINHGDFVIRYGEVNNDSPEKQKLSTGSKVKAGQILGKATYCGMLHLEVFKKGATSGGNWYPNYRFLNSDTISCLKKTMTVDFKKNATNYCTGNNVNNRCKKNWKYLKNLQDPTNLIKALYTKDQPSHCGTATGKQ